MTQYPNPEKDYGMADRVVSGAAASTPTNTNMLLPTNFMFNLKRVPNMKYFVQEFTLPESSSEAISSEWAVGPAVKFPKSGFTYGTLTIKFLINEDFSNYYEIIKWMLQGTGYSQFIVKQPKNENAVDDASLILLTNKKVPFRRIEFRSLIPTELSGIEFANDVTDITTLTATVKFSISGYQITNL
jgi:hypothetical protein